jgi:ribosomal protein S24E
MAKKEKVEGAAPKGDAKGRKVMITETKTGKLFARVDVIKDLWNNGTGLKRGEIKKVLAEKYGHEVAYQIVFAATKGAGKAEEAAAAA